MRTKSVQQHSLAVSTPKLEKHSAISTPKLEGHSLSRCTPPVGEGVVDSKTDHFKELFIASKEATDELIQMECQDTNKQMLASGESSSQWMLKEHG